MRKTLLSFLTALAVTVGASVGAFGQLGQIPTYITPPSATYQGPGDVNSGAAAWGSCARVYQASLASTSTNLCDLVQGPSGASPGTAVCTLRGSSTGFVDLTSSYCASTTPSAACSAITGGCFVSKVYDQTGNGFAPVQATNADQPARTFSALGGLPFMTFTSVQFLEWSGSKSFTLPNTYSAVARRTGNFTSFGGIVAASNAGLSPINSANTWSLYNGTEESFTASDSSFHAVQGVLNGASSAFQLDSTQGSLASPGTSTPINSWFIGRLNGASITGNICEAGVWINTAWSTTQTGNMNTNQHSATSGYNF